MLVLRPIHAFDRKLLPFGNLTCRMWPPAHRASTGFEPAFTPSGASCLWKTKRCCGYDAGEAVLFRPLRCRPAPRPSFHPSQYGSGRVAALTSYSARLWAEAGAALVIGPSYEKAWQCIVPETGKISRPVWVALTPVFPTVLSPGFEPGPDSSLDCRLYRLGYESIARTTRRDMPARSTIDPAALCRIPAPMPAVAARTFPQSCGSADKKRGRPRSRKPFPHWADRLYRMRRKTPGFSYGDIRRLIGCGALAGACRKASKNMPSTAIVPSCPNMAAGGWRR